MIGLVLGVVVVFPLVLTYAGVVAFFDRFRRAPFAVFALAFVWGAVFSTFGGGLASLRAAQVLSRLTGAALDSPAMEAASATVLAPVFEEGAKGLGVALLLFLFGRLAGRVEGLLQATLVGGLVGLGFTATEDVLYVTRAFRAEGLAGLLELAFVRTVLLGLSHATFTACTGVGLGVASESRRLVVRLLAPGAGFAAAIAMHAVHNALPTFVAGVGLLAMILVTWASGLVLFGLLALLALRDRRTLVRQLFDEVDRLLDRRELVLLTTVLARVRRDLSALRVAGLGAYLARTRRADRLLRLAFVKHRLAERGGSPALARELETLRAALARDPVRLA